MADETTQRPLSGEIISAAGHPFTLVRSCGDIVEAEFEAVAAAPVAAAARMSGSPPLSGLDGLVPPRPPALLARPGGAAFWSAGLALAAAAFWVSGGHVLVRPAATPVPERQVRVAGVTSRVDAAAGRAYLFVEGQAVNDGSSPADLPPLEISVTGSDGAVSRYRLAKSGERLAAGARTPFSSRLDLPKNGVKAVTVTVAR